MATRSPRASPSRPGMLMAMDSGIATGSIEGESTKEPAFGLAAWWIEPQLKGRAETMNYTVVDPTSVLATHLTEVVRSHADELLTRDEVNNLLEQSRPSPPNSSRRSSRRSSSPANCRRSCRTCSASASRSATSRPSSKRSPTGGPRPRTSTVLTEYVRNALRRTICEQYAGPRAMSGSPDSSASPSTPTLRGPHHRLHRAGPGGTSFTMPARVAAGVTEQILRALQLVTASGHHAVVIASPAGAGDRPTVDRAPAARPRRSWATTRSSRRSRSSPSRWSCPEPAGPAAEPAAA